MTANEYQQAAIRTLKNTYKNIDESGKIVAPSEQMILHALMGICSEAGEIADNIKKHFIYSQALDYDNIDEECGDLLWYITILLYATGYTIEDAMLDNIEKLKIRYPEKYTDELAKERLDKKGE